MGGAAGHMNHLYDNGDLTFKEMKEIFTAASNGELKGTEKTDGKNIFISYSVRLGSARAVRNKGNIKQGGLSAEELADKFEGRGELKDAFVDSFKMFEKAVRSLDLKTQVKIFGEDADVYYNAEIMDPRTPNVVNYDTKTLVIHQVGHGMYDKQTGEKALDKRGKVVDISSNIEALQNALGTMQKATADEEYSIQINAIRNLKKLDSDIALYDATQALDSTINSIGLSERSTISDYIAARLKNYVNKNASYLDDDRKELLIKRLMNLGPNISKVLNGLPSEQKESVRSIISKEKDLIKSAIKPIEAIVHDFSVEMLKGLESSFILDNNKEVQRLRSEVSKAIKAIEGSAHEGAMAILKSQMEKLKNAQNVATASEGFVFDYNGITYKFTGNFAPINQILGLFKYGRGDFKAMVKEEEREADDNRRFGGMLKENEELADVAIVPGAFKPPHRGHLSMVKEYANMAKKVIVFMSPLARKMPDGRDLTYDMANSLWEIYLKAEGLNNVSIIRSPVNSPVGAAYKFVANQENDPNWAQPGNKILLGCSNKDDDASRFGESVQKYAREGVEVIANMPVLSESDSDGGNPLSASGMREAIAERDVNKFANYLPKSLKNNAEVILNKYFPREKPNSATVTESSDFILTTIKSYLSEARKR
jgi:cytidyltransferase-like protein